MIAHHFNNLARSKSIISTRAPVASLGATDIEWLPYQYLVEIEMSHNYASIDDACLPVQYPPPYPRSDPWLSCSFILSKSQVPALGLSWLVRWWWVSWTSARPDDLEAVQIFQKRKLFWYTDIIIVKLLKALHNGINYMKWATVCYRIFVVDYALLVHYDASHVIIGGFVPF